jgi:ligand-binding sensor domain-containing protein
MKTHTSCICIIVLLFFSLSSCKKEDKNNISQTIIQYTRDNGLPFNHINSLAIDFRGNVWIGGDFCYSVAMFNGQNWVNYNIHDILGSVGGNSIAVDSKDNKWFGTNNGVVKFDGTNWTKYGISDGLPDTMVNAIAIDSLDNKWFGTNKGLSKFDGKHWQTFTIEDGLLSNKIYSIVIDLKNNKWITTAHGISKFDDIQWTSILVDNGENEAIAVDHEGNIWTGFLNLMKYDGTIWTTFNDVSFVGIFAITIDKNNNKWIGTLGDPINKIEEIYKFDGTNWKQFGNYGRVSSIALDSLNNVWYGTIDGVSKIILSN